MNYIKSYFNNHTQLQTIMKNIFSYKNINIDHIAHRSFNRSKVLKHYLVESNYILQKDKYTFTKYNTNAFWYKDKIHNTPRLFISEYEGVQTDTNFKDNKVDINELEFYIKRPQLKLPYTLYENVKERNQYVAWTLVHRNHINHIAFNVEHIENVMEKVKTIMEVNDILQVSEDKKLLQFSTKAGTKKVAFQEGEFEVPYHFIEFIERKHCRDGFSEKNANIIMESTG